MVQYLTPTQAARELGLSACRVRQPLLEGRQVYTVLCTASEPIRRQRLQQRVRDGYRLSMRQTDYVTNLLKIGPSSIEPDIVLDTTTNATATAILATIEAWLRQTG